MIQWTRILDELAGIAGPERFKTDPTITARYTVDGVVPRAVVFPRDTQMVAAVMRSAFRENLAVVPWGSGTKMSLGNPPNRVDLVICMARMNHMLDVDTANLTITVEAGVKFRDVQARLATEEDRCYLPLEDLKTEADEFVCSERSHSGCFVPLDPPFSERATIGGIVATNNSGPRRLLYGLPRDLLLGVRFVTPRGEVIGAGGKTVKNVSGYDISKLMIGSMGSLGILCEMTLKLLPLPERMETLLFDFESFSQAGDFADAVLGTKLLPAALEVADRAILTGLDFEIPDGLGSGAHVAMIALEAFDEAVTRMGKDLKTMAAAFKATGQSLLREERHRLFWLALGDLESELLQRCPHLMVLRLNYPLSRWREILEVAGKTAAKARLDHSLMCHAGSGVTLLHLLPDGAGLQDEAMVETVKTLLDVCRGEGGNLVVQRAPLHLKPALPVWGNARQDLPLMKRIRREVDPSGIMNPGRSFIGM